MLRSAALMLFLSYLLSASASAEFSRSSGLSRTTDSVTRLLLDSGPVKGRTTKKTRRVRVKKKATKKAAPTTATDGNTPAAGATDANIEATEAARDNPATRASASGAPHMTFASGPNTGTTTTTDGNAPNQVRKEAQTAASTSRESTQSASARPHTSTQTTAGAADVNTEATEAAGNSPAARASASNQPPPQITKRKRTFTQTTAGADDANTEAARNSPASRASASDQPPAQARNSKRSHAFTQTTSAVDDANTETKRIARNKRDLPRSVAGPTSTTSKNTRPSFRVEYPRGKIPSSQNTGGFLFSSPSAGLNPPRAGSSASPERSEIQHSLFAPPKKGSFPLNAERPPSPSGAGSLFGPSKGNPQPFQFSSTATSSAPATPTMKYDKAPNFNKPRVVQELNTHTKAIREAQRTAKTGSWWSQRTSNTKIALAAAGVGGVALVADSLLD